MKIGHVVEYIDRQKIICAVILEIKKQRLRLLTENNREVNLSASRLSHKGEVLLDLSMSRDKVVSTLREIAKKRKKLIDYINIKELWERKLQISEIRYMKTMIIIMRNFHLFFLSN